MNIKFKILTLTKRFPLAISRGVHAGSENLFVFVEKNGITGIGEMTPGKSEGAETAKMALDTLQDFVVDISLDADPRVIYQQALEQGVAPCALAALDIALWDLRAKEAGLPLYKLLGLALPSVATSVTIGINPPEVVKERVPLLLDGTGVKSLKIKLGSAEGVEADKAMYAQVVESTKPYQVQLRVDANGGWNVAQAQHMMNWIADRGADYIEQPLREGAEGGLATLFKNRPLPIFIDESCRFASDVTKWADCIDGANMKLMKCGGITGALDIIQAAKKHGLNTMIGCMGESSVSISAAAALTGAIDHIDLDSHLNLAPDPATGAEMENGIMMPNELVGHGAELKAEYI